MSPTLIARERAFELIASLGDHPLDAWEKQHARNYELESYLSNLTGAPYVIAEICPFNGVYCAWGALRAESRAWRDIWEQVPTRHKQDGNIRAEAPVQTVLRLLRELEDEEDDPSTVRNCTLVTPGDVA